MDDMERFRTITRSYPALQGLYQIPVAVVILAVWLQNLGFPSLGGLGNLIFLFPLLIITGLLWLAIRRYYEKTYGFVEPSFEKRRKALTVLILLLVYLGFVIIDNHSIQSQGLLPVSLSGIFIGFLFIGSGRNPRRFYYTALGLLLVLECLLPPIMGKSTVDPIFGKFGLLYGLTFGIGLMVVSLVDHFRLVRLLRPVGGGRGV